MTDLMPLHPLTTALGRALLHSVWQYTLLALGLGCLSRMLEHHSATLRYALAYGTLVFVPVIFVSTTLRAYSSQTAVVPTVMLSLGIEPHMISSIPTLIHLPLLTPLLPGLALLWGLGIILMALYLLGGWLHITRLHRHATPLPTMWQGRLLELAERLQVHRTLRLTTSAWIEVPTVIGWLRPIILVPPSAITGLTTLQLELILAHELIHIRRNDYLLNFIQNVIEVLFFYHPAVWWVSGQIRTEREHCCDDAVIDVFGDALTYARALTVLEGTRLERPQLAMAASGGVLMNRVRRLINPSQRVSTSTRFLTAAALLLGGVLLAACASGTVGVSTPVAQQAVCLGAEVYAGRHVIPAFNTASVNAMRRAARGTDLVLADTCDASSLRLMYRMAFNARTLSWQAELQALTTSGEVAWQGSETAHITQDGAFQYLTESNAERLLTRFASDWATLR